MTKDTINKKIERYGAKEFHLADAFLGASVMLAVIALWFAFAVPPKATKSEIATLEKRIEWLQDSNLDRIRDIGDVELQVLKLNNNLKDLKSDIKQYDSKLKAEANRDQFFEMIDRLIERADRDGVGQ